jgi:hypothetical protein
METKFYVPKEKKNKIEKNLNEIYESFYHPISMNEI